MTNSRHERLALVLVLVAVANIVVALVLACVVVGIAYGVEKGLALAAFMTAMTAVACLAGASKALQEDERDDG